MAFNVMARNFDHHPKNFAFRLKERADWELATQLRIQFRFRYPPLACVLSGKPSFPVSRILWNQLPVFGRRVTNDRLEIIDQM
jgi:hypothetical protein